MASLSSAEIDAFEVDIGMLVNAINNLDEFEYDGFDPTAFRTMLLKTWVQKGYNKPQINTLILNALSIVLMRGIKINLAANSKMKASALVIARELANAGVTMKPSAGAQGADVITLGRIQSVFPNEMSMMLASQRARVVGNKPDDLPSLFCHSSIFSILPVDLDFDSAFTKTLMEWRLSFTSTIMPGKTEAQAAESMVKFDKLIFNSKLYSPAQRGKLLKKAFEMELGAVSAEKKARYIALIKSDAAMVRLFA